jgi:predicted ATPase
MKPAAKTTLHLKSLEKKSSVSSSDSFPFNLPLIKGFDRIEFRRPVTFFVGENGSGKSTLLEAIAAGVGSITVGGDDVDRDETLRHARKLASAFRFSWHKRTARGFFLRAEDFFNFAKRINRMSAELEELANSYDEKFSGYALGLAKGAVLGQKFELAKKYGEDADARSHGESFLHLFQSRFVPGGLYLLDEPEAPLSPLRQLSLISMLKEMVEQRAQFIIATHSPILMAFPDASIVSFDKYPLRETAYEDIEHVNLTRSFLNNPEAFLRLL